MIILQERVKHAFFADGSTIDVPIAKIFIDTPYISGTYEAWCMETPVYDCIVGNVDNVREPGKPDPNWKPVIAVETRQQASQKVSLFPSFQPQKLSRTKLALTTYEQPRLKTIPCPKSEFMPRTMRPFIQNGVK